MDVVSLLEHCVKSRASDLHLAAGMPPMMRVDGNMQRTDFAVVSDDDVEQLIGKLMDEKQRRAYAEMQEIDFSFELRGIARFRVNAFKQHAGAAAVFRTVPTRIMTLQQLGLGDVFKQICSFSSGLVVVTGATGSGKSTTLAAMVDFINSSRYQHILTIEDPIECVHTSKNCLINQREVHRHTRSFHEALRAALREDPDIILLGELRDPETIRLALTAAETGHLVLASLHTSSAAKTIDRIVDVFAGDEKAMVRSMLSESLQAVVSQALLPKIAGGRVAALEIMLVTSAIRNLIREDKVAQMYSAIQTGASLGMKTLDQHLKELVQTGMISKESAQLQAKMPQSFI